ncbi:zinc finger MYM-type protein 1 [Trichonephila clavipes]|nr:zinc finger MYM-type protein 1 [Trichonephila clavipes]
MLVWLTRKENKSVLDKQLQEQLRKDIEYYHNVLKRVIAVVKYLAIIGLAFREFLETNGLLLDHCRGQSFDNAANKSGQYNGVQALLKEKNKFANYVQCAAHSLNLVRAELVKEYQDAAKKISPSLETEYSDVNKRRVISKFADKSSEKAVHGQEKFKRDTLIVALDKLILDLNRRSQVYAEYRLLNKLFIMRVWSRTYGRRVMGLSPGATEDPQGRVKDQSPHVGWVCGSLEIWVPAPMSSSLLDHGSKLSKSISNSTRVAIRVILINTNSLGKYYFKKELPEG